MPGTAFGKVRVLDLTTEVAGPYATKLLADYGADVIKVEPVSGDRSRTMGPFWQNDPNPEKSLTYFYLNCNKRGVTLNLESSAGRQVLRELVMSADILVENHHPGYMEGLGLGYSELEKINRRLIMTSITPFGQTGPYKDYRGNDLVYYASSGIMYTSGAYDREPLKHGHPQSLFLGGMVAAYASVGALFARMTTGEGQHMDVSLSEVMAAHGFMPQVRYAFSGAVTRRAIKGDTGDPKGTGFRGVVPAKDGHVIFDISPPARLYPRSAPPPWPEYGEFAEMLGRPELGQAIEDASTAEQLDALLKPVIAEMTMLEYFHRIMKHEWEVAVSQTTKDLVNCPQLEERGYFTEVEHPIIGKIKFPGAMVKMTGSPWSLRFPAPLLGQHNQAVYRGEIGYSLEDLVRLRQVGAI